MQSSWRPFKLALILAVALCTGQANASSSPTVGNGVLNLTGWNSQDNPRLSLEGEWKFYWDRHLDPSIYDDTIRSQAYSAPVPGSWSELVAPGSSTKTLSAYGKATYTLDIIINDNTPKNLSIAISQIGTSYKLFALNSEGSVLISKMGELGDSPQTSSPKMQARTVPLNLLSQDRLTLILQVSNFIGSNAGLIGTPVIGLTEHIEAAHTRKSLWLFLCIGALLILCMSQTLALLAHPHSRIHRALTCLTLLAIALLALRGHLFQALDPSGHTFNFQRLHRLELLSLASMLPCLTLLYRPHLIREGKEKTLLASVACSAAFFIFAWTANITGVVSSLPYVSFLLALCTLTLIKSMVHNKTTQPTEKKLWITGTLLLSTALLTTAFLGSNDTLETFLNINWVLALGAFCLAGNQLETRTRQFEPQLNQNLKREVEVRTASLKRQTEKAVQDSEDAKASEYEALEAGFEAEVAREQLAEEKHKQEIFVQNISHELRTPLTLILNPLQIVANENPEDHNLQVALHNAQRLLGLVNQLLDFQLLGRGNRTIDIRPVDLVSFVQTCSEYFAYSCLQKHIRFKTTIEGRQLEEVIDSNDKPLIFVLSEVDALEKVIFNLLSNALKFTPDGGEIELGIQSVENHARVFVTDNGPGIKAEDQQRIFNAFAQVDDSETRSYEGTGLGLAYAKRLVESMNGQLELQSIPDLGSRFWVSLPVCEEPETSGNNTFRVKDWLLADGGYHASEHAQISQNNPGAENVASKGTILIVDDLPEMRKLIEHTLVKRGYNILEAENGKVGFELASAHKPDLIVTDWMMPIMSGTDLINELKSTAGLSAIPVILLTAKSDKKSKEQAISLGADGFLSKPFEQIELTSMVRNLMKLRTAERQAADEQRKNALSQVAAQLAHELNNPLNFIGSGMDNIREYHDEMESVVNKLMKGTGDEAKSVRDFFKRQFQSLDEVVADIQVGVLRSGHVVQEIRTLTGVDGGALEKMQILLEIQEQFKALVRENGSHFVGISLKHLAKEPGIYEGNPVIFRRVILSSLECCAQWSLQSGTPEILVEIERSRYGELTIRFSQNGEKYNPDTAPTLLELREEGAGMDAVRRLTLLKSLWQDHGGNITINRMGVNQRYIGFCVTLPVAKRKTSEPSISDSKKQS